MRRTIQAQLDELLQGPPPGVTAGPDDDDLFQWTGIIQGPPGSPPHALSLTSQQTANQAWVVRLEEHWLASSHSQRHAAQPLAWKEPLSQGPAAGTPYEGGVFFLDIQFPDNYPFEPPRVKFTTPLYHPNVNDKGGICLSILFQGCTWDQGWSPAMSISSVLLSLTILLQEPNTDHSLRPDLAAQYLADREAYNTAAREHTKQHAM
ncbi:hypothetical protein QJQ45_012691 [Haematococcus lacustris]|nr:hypothetical protein QJQ45_012691 [Haematococcus lacustris]